MASGEIIIRGARQHNLKGIDLRIPRDKLVVVTGLSGSGKTSLAFDTIYAEGQRRYVESLSAYARQFLELMSKPDVDSIEGLSPAISIEQRALSHNPRSTVGTVTEIYDYLRLLFARVGHPHCYKCGREITTQTIQQMVDKLVELPEGTRLVVLAPIVRDRKGEYRRELEQLRRAGYVRVRIDGTVYELEEEISLDKRRKHSIEVFVDRITHKGEKTKARLADSLETALRLAEGIVKVEEPGPKPDTPPGSSFLFSERFACPECGISYPEISPRFFSFNNPYGACPACAGLGTRMYFDPDLIIPNESLNLREGAIAPWEKRTSFIYRQTLASLAGHFGFDLNTPWKKLPAKVKKILLNGSGDEEIEFTYEGRGKYVYKRPFEGVIPHLDRRYHETDSDYIREELERFMTIRPCPECNGARLKIESLHVKINGLNISQLTEKSIKDTRNFFDELKLTDREERIAKRILKEIRERLAFLENVGLDYLTLDRASGSLAGGEGQRIRLATQIGSRLVGVLYILDEPTIGLHQRDNKRLLDTLFSLRDLGNTILVVEHDAETILSSDYVIDMGPGAGETGGDIVARGTPEDILKNPDSVTGAYLSGNMNIPIPERRRVGKGAIKIVGAKEHNLKKLTVDFPLGNFICVTGVSGSGKSTLLIDTLYAGLKQRIYRSKVAAGKMKQIVGWEAIDKVVDIDQSPIGRTPRSNPATYTGLFTPIRDLFAKLPASKMRGYAPGRFSFNVKGGRCEACSGDGLIKIEMHFLPDVFVQCDVCKGKRYNRETLEIHYRGKNIADVLDMTVDEAFEFLENIPAIRSKLSTLRDVGLGYIRLGQSATTLSGGEAQRVKLAKELSRRATGNTFYILDEPTTGLHFHDIRKLLEVLQRLVDQGNTVVVIEHNLDVIKCADYIIDLGPEGGEGGGGLVAVGTPEEVAVDPDSHTGRYLKDILENGTNKKTKKKVARNIK